MISRRTFVLTLAAGTLLAGALPVLAKSGHAGAIGMFDTDNDGTIDLAEAKKAASSAFDRLERDHDGTLDKRELARRLTAKELTAADPDHDGVTRRNNSHPSRRARSRTLLQRQRQCRCAGMRPSSGKPSRQSLPHGEERGNGRTSRTMETSEAIKLVSSLVRRAGRD